MPPKNIVDTKVIILWSAPKPKPIDIFKNNMINSSGSLIGVLNLTIDKAPTKPKESAKDDFTMAITNIVVIESKRKF